MEDWLNFIITTPLSEANWQFQELKAINLPTLATYMGYLSATKQVRHLLTCTKLTGWKSSDFKNGKFIIPDKFSPEATHDFIAIYQRVASWKEITILFRFQIHSNDSIALELFQLLIKAMKNSKKIEDQYLLNPVYDHLWKEIAKIKLQSLTSANTNFFPKP